MAGRMISLVPKSTFSLNFVVGNGSGIQVGRGFYDTRDACSGVLLLRVVSQTTPTGGVFNFQFSNILLLPDDPSNTYVPYSGGTVVNLNTATGTINTPTLFTGSFSSATTPLCGPMTAVLLGSIISGTNTGTGSITFLLDLLVRDSS